MTAQPKSAAPACPYCKGTITPELLRAGGNCPHCMLEIPGEEAPTDPGLEQKKKIAEVNLALERKKKRRSLLRNLALLALLLAAGAAGLWRMQAAEDELVYELDDVYMAPRDGMIVYRDQPVEPAAAGTQPTGKKPTGKRDLLPPKLGEIPTTPSGTNAPSGSDGSPTVSFKPAGSGGQDIAVGSSLGGPGSSALGEVDIKLKRTNTFVLENDDEILAMAKDVTSTYAPQIEGCVAARLKADPGFSGAWKVSFTIQTDGTVGKLSAKALETADPDVEACITRKIGSWGFQKISHEFKVAKTYRFSGREG